MSHRKLGKTGLSVSPIGFGAFKIGRNEQIKYPQAYELPDRAAVDRLLNGLLDAGVNHIDTAPAYGLSEQRIGETIAHRRHEFLLSTKVGEIFENGRSRYEFSRAAIRQSVQQSLARLRVDAVDLLLIHAPADDLPVLNDTDAVDTLQRLKAEGLTRVIGFSGKSVSAARQAIDWADVLMVEYHSRDRSHQEVIGEAAAAGLGVIVKKGLASGHLSPAEAIRFVLETPGVGNLVIGGLNLDHFRENLSIASGCTSAI